MIEISRSVRTAVLLSCLLFPAVGRADFNDPPLQHVTETFWKGDPLQTLRVIDSELEQNPKDPWLVAAWTYMHSLRGDLEKALRDFPDGSQKKHLASLAEILLAKGGPSASKLLDDVDGRLADPAASPWGFVELANLADENDKPNLKRRILISGVARFPDQFQLVWNLVDDGSPDVRRMISDSISSRAIASGSPAERLLSKLLTRVEWEPADLVEAGRDWLSLVPGDPRASAMVATNLNELGRFEEAASLAQVAARSFPFYYNSRALVTALARTHQLAKGEKSVVEFTGGFFGKDPPFDELSSSWWADALRDEGDNGAARQVLTDALHTSPTSTRVATRLARLEIADKRFAEAAAIARRLLDQDPKSNAAHELLLQALQNDKHSLDAVDAWKSMATSGWSTTRRAYLDLASAFEALGDDPGTERTLLEEGLKAYPDNLPISRAYAGSLWRTGEQLLALSRLQQLVETDVSNLWTIRRLADWTRSSQGVSAAKGVFHKIIERYPQQSQLWEQLVDFENDLTQKIAVLDEAKRQSRNWAWPWVEEAQLLVDARKWSDALIAARNAVQAISPEDTGQYIQVLQIEPWILGKQSHETALSSDDLNHSLKQLDRYRDRGGSLITYYSRREPILMGLAREDEAASSALTAAYMSPSVDTFHHLVDTYGYILGSRALIYGAEALSRVPMNREAVETFVNAQVLWEGSPVVALKTIYDARGRGVPDGPGIANLEGRAYGQLGDGVRQFKSSYIDCGCRPSTSDRYIDWYADARRKVMTSQVQVRLVTTDPLPTVDIIAEDGSVVRRTDDPNLGKLLSLTRGKAFLHAKYDENGDLIRIENSAGAWVEITYRDRNISTIADNTGTKVNVDYQNKRIQRVSVKDLGDLYLEYDEQGKLKGTNAQPSPSSKGQSSQRLAITISSTLTRLTELVSQVEHSERNNQIPNLPFSDPVINKLRESQSLRLNRGTEHDSAALRLAKYEIEHLQDSPDYLDEAKSRLVAVIEDNSRQSSTVSERSLAVDSILLWQQALKASNTYGLRRPEFERWSKYQQWLQTIASSGQKAAQAALDKMGQQPELLDKPWFLDHPIGNPGYWQRWSIPEILPPDASHKAILVRRNGDVVIGTTTGLAVYRKKYWLRLSYNPNRGAFDDSPTSNSRDPQCSVLALAETDDRTLWVGTETGLLAITGDYMDRVKSWRSSMDGLPSPRITSLADEGNAVWIGTSAGLRVWDGKTITSIGSQFETQSVRSIQVSSKASFKPTMRGQLSSAVAKLNDTLQSEVRRILRSSGSNDDPSEALLQLSDLLQAAPMPSEQTKLDDKRLATTLRSQMEGWGPGDPDVLKLDIDDIEEKLANSHLPDADQSALVNLRKTSKTVEEFASSAANLISQDSTIDSSSRAGIVDWLRNIVDVKGAERERKDWLQHFLGDPSTKPIEKTRPQFISLLDSDATATEVATKLTSFLEDPAAFSQAENVAKSEVMSAAREYVAMTSYVVVATDSAVEMRREGRWITIASRPVDAVIHDIQSDSILILDHTRITRRQFSGSSLGAETPMLGQTAVRFQREIYGLANLLIPGVGFVPAALTDQGVALYHDNYFQFFELPFKDRRNGLQVGPRLASSAGKSVWLATDEGVYAFEPNRAIIASGIHVYDLLSDQDTGVTYVAAGSRLGFVDQANPERGLQHFSDARATSIALDKHTGDIITNDGETILRYKGGRPSAVELFSVADTGLTPEDLGREGSVKNILVSRDGSIWVAAGATVFRWKDGVLDKFNWFADPTRFPARSEKISRIVETVEGDILAIASDEGHIEYRGVNLVGGVLRFVGHRFEVMPRSTFGDWFITGYTQIDDKTAIVGTNNGYSRVRNGKYRSFRDLKDPSYNRLTQDTQLVWLGGTGARFDEASWLFPSAGGVLLWHNERWMYPIRLNRLLPDDALFGQYGGRTVHAVAADSNGTIYAGTDRGLLIYLTGGSSSSLLIDNSESQLAFDDANTQQLNEQREVLVGSLDKNSVAGSLVTSIQQIDHKIEALTDQPAIGVEVERDSHLSPSPAAKGNDAAPVSPEHTPLQLELRHRAEVLASLESENFGLFKLLTADPRELGAVHDELPAEDAIVQYILDKRVIHIQVVTRAGPELFDVEVDYESLDRRVRSVASALAASAKWGSEGSGSSTLIASISGILQGRQGDLSDNLGWLYDVLIRPISGSIANRKHVYIVPSGHLYYLPFAALKDSLRTDHPYLVEQYNIGILPSLFQLDLVLRQRHTSPSKNLIVGDPDNSLPGAREEAREIGTILGSNTKLEIGDEATIDEFRLQAPTSRIIHLATHGYLDRVHPAESYLVMAGGRRMSIIDFQITNLSSTDLVALSACETGIGRDGLEIATMARAFAHANVPTVVATLWKVDDKSTAALMEEFYQAYHAGADAFISLARAQRNLLRRSDAMNAPQFWAGVVVFGRP